MRAVETDVLIIGAGPAGLTASALLARAGVRAITVTKHRGTADSPRAHITNQRTMEVFRDLKADGNVEAVGMPHELMGCQIFATSFSGLELSRMKTWGAGSDRRHDYDSSSPCRMHNIPQHVLEPILLTVAKHHGADIRFKSELIRIRQDEGAVEGVVADYGEAAEYIIRAKYVIGADGAKSVVGEQLGFDFEGSAALGHAVSAWVEADLTKYTRHRSGAIAFIAHQDSDLWMSVWPCVKPWTEWNPFFLRYNRAHGDASEEGIRTHIAAAIGDPNIEFKIKKISRWQVNQMVASRYRIKRAFLVGDAAHRHPPANGLGSNTSIQDSYNLAWKIALVLQGSAPEALLDTYNSERQPVGRQVIDRAIRSQREMLPWSDAVGLRPGMTTSDARANIEELFGDSEEGAKRRYAVEAGIRMMNGQFNAHGVELGQRYRLGAIADDNTPFPEYIRDPELYYQPTTHPGAHLPHVWVENGPDRISTIDVADYGRFTLITGIGGSRWLAAAQAVSADLGVKIAVVPIGMRLSNDDVYGDWTKQREINDGGCILVRPDRVVGWRTVDLPSDPTASLHRAMQKILQLDSTPTAARAVAAC
ncbi:FAD-dependent monooxygenase [Bradyrhizobium sp. WYCCWR 13022]|nr:FAD-dependent monooxygenase [Bradyrhizobium sp. WYCCWR 13022]MDN4984311.1 FAD-dependent monooxygenase [Bradyrhizobium sp. WYCCWR 13022]